MKIAVEHLELKKIAINKEIEFPLYYWWDAHKEKIIKMYPEYYEHDPKLIKHITIIKVNLGWNTDARIVKEYVLVHNNLIENKIEAYFNDYTTPATEAEFLEIREKAIKDLL